MEMRLVSALYLCLVLTLGEASCSTRLHDLSYFHAKLQQRISAVSPPAPATGNPKQSGRVLYPIGYGADPTGTRESSQAILSAVSDAFKVQTQGGVQQMLPGLTDLGGVLIDLQGGTYSISQPIRFPAGGANLVLVGVCGLHFRGWDASKKFTSTRYSMRGGTLRASTTFPSDRHLVELWSPNSQGVHGSLSSAVPNGTAGSTKVENVGIYYEDITFRDILFDSSFQGGGIYVVDSARIRITNCFFLHFTTEGIIVKKGHEAMISGCFLGQHSTVGGDRGERNFSGTAIDLQSNDNAITDVVIFSAAIGIVLRGQANIITGAHCYNKATYFGGIGVSVTLGASQTRLDNCYMDFTGIVMEDPVQVHVTNGFFLGDANVVLKSIKGRISGLNVQGNMFTGNPQQMNPIVALDGQFSSIDQVLIDQNNVEGMKLKSTAAKLTVRGNGTRWIADFSSVLVFPNQINHFQYAFYATGESGFLKHAITNVSNNVVVVECEAAVSALVSVAVDQYNMAGEIM